MPYSSKAVANYFLDKSFEEDIALSPMKLQKLVYYAQGWHLGVTGKPLMNEQIECWKYGPVCTSLFHHFKDFGSDPITRRACYIKVAKVGGKRGFKNVIPKLPTSIEGETFEVLDAVWNSYKRFSAVRLSNMTHAAGEPWAIVFNQYNGDPPRGTDIPMDLIRKHFETLVNNG